jgi:hypothetical protein
MHGKSHKTFPPSSREPDSEDFRQRELNCNREATESLTNGSCRWAKPFAADAATADAQ